MVTVEEARLIAEKFNRDNVPLKKGVVWDEGDYYVYGYEEIVEMGGSICVNKTTGVPGIYMLNATTIPRMKKARIITE